MIAVVLDTNVLASGFVSQGSATPPAQLLDAWRAGAFTLVVSEHILMELAQTLQEPYFRRRLTPQYIADDLALLHEEALIVPLSVMVQGVATHPEDDLILATCLSAKADYLVTGDGQLQKLGTYHGVAISSPADFVRILAAQGPA